DWDGWPDGTFERFFTHEEYVATKKLAVHWTCRTSGGTHGSRDAETWEGGRRSIRYCKGVLVCRGEGCGRTVRSQVLDDRIESQLGNTCECGGRLEHVPCSATHTITIFKHGLAEQNPRSGPLQLLVGVPTLHGPGPKAPDISSVLLNKDRISHELQKVRAEAKSAKGGDSLNFEEFAAFDADNPGLVVHSVVGKVTVISIQQPLMLSELVKETAVTDEPVNGVVSHAAHGFWRQRNCLLMISSAYSRTLRCWLPGILSYTNGATAEHFQHHFYALFKSIAQERARRGWDTSSDEHFGTVVDFSEAERNGFIAAFIQFRQSEGSTRTADDLKAAAEGLLKGCKQHFRSGITRLTWIGGVI
ncbi:hypothetical protein K466DRAFT_460510, partial [Polyporus arcularius HHB13444]